MEGRRVRHNTNTFSGLVGSISNSHSTTCPCFVVVEEEEVVVPRTAKSNKLPALLAATAAVASALFNNKTSSEPSANVSFLGPVIVTLVS